MARAVYDAIPCSSACLLDSLIDYYFQRIPSRPEWSDKQRSKTHSVIQDVARVRALP